jgi:hypothetical protein
MPIPVYRWLLEDPSGAKLGEIMNAHDRQLQLGISSIPTASFRVRLDNRFANSLLNDDLLLIVYRDVKIVFHGIVISAEETADEAGNRQIQANAAGVMWRLSKRLIPASRTEAGFSFSGTPGAVVAGIVTGTNQESFTGLDGEFY